MNGWRYTDPSGPGGLSAEYAAHVVAAALAWADARALANTLRAQRAAVQCERRVDDEPPCWQADPPSGYTQRSAELFGWGDGWCVACRSRQLLHWHYRDAVAARQGALRRLIAACGGSRPRRRVEDTGTGRSVLIREEARRPDRKGRTR